MPRQCLLTSGDCSVHSVLVSVSFHHDTRWTQSTPSITQELTRTRFFTCFKPSREQPSTNLRVIKNSVHCISQYVTRCKSVCIKISFFVCILSAEKKTRNWDQCSMSDRKTFYHFFFSYFHMCPAYGFTSQNIQSSFPDIFSVQKCFTKIKFARNVLPCLVARTAVEYEHQLGRIISVWKLSCLLRHCALKAEMKSSAYAKIIEGERGGYPCQSLNQSNNIGWTYI